MYLLQRPLKPQMELSSDELAAALVTAHWFQKQVTTQATADRKPMPKAAICGPSVWNQWKENSITWATKTESLKTGLLGYLESGTKDRYKCSPVWMASSAAE
ncbi:uncharacterized protein LOC143448211 [Clavelina lepadiformis]|uniref:uncharacterized protein LOC143448211 n=1 Tax=Clavelina lepadiformis TaxID=159417 RepID=UPI0040410749